MVLLVSLWKRKKTEAEAPCSSYPKGLTKFDYEGSGGGKQVPPPSSVLTEDDGGPPRFDPFTAAVDVPPNRP